MAGTARYAGLEPLAAACILAALAAIGLDLVLIATRLADAISFAHPLHVITSGFEQSSLIAMWNAAVGNPVYGHPRSIPFTLANFNWLYYAAYGGVARLGLNMGGLDPAWIPTIGRLLTLVGAVLGSGVAYALFRRLAPARDAFTRLLCLALAVHAFLGPLTGWWAITVRPDLWASVLETAGLLAFLGWSGWRSMPAAVMASLLFSAAWSMKQIAIVALCGAGIGTAVNRAWRALPALGLPFLIVAGVTLALLPAAYHQTMADLAATVAFSLRQGAINGVNFAAKALPALTATGTLAALALLSPASRAEIVGDRSLPVTGAVAATGLVVALTGAAKVGGAENYFFTPHLMLCAVTAAGIGLLQRLPAPARRSLLVAMAVGWAAQAAATGAVLAGLAGAVSVRGTHEGYEAARRCIQVLPKPAYVDGAYLNLPWMNPSRPPFVLSFRYWHQRQQGLPFEAGGVGGLIEAGRFAALLLPEGAARYDGAALDGYARRDGVCPGWSVWERRAP